RGPGRAGARLPVGVEVVLRATGDEVRLLVDPPSNPFRLVPVGEGAPAPDTVRLEVADPPPGLFHARAEQRFNLPYHTVPNEDGRYDSMRVLVNRRRFTGDSTEVLGVGYDRGILRPGPAPDGLWEPSGDGRVLEVRVPWHPLNVTDASSRHVLQGPGEGNTRDAVLGPDGRWVLRPGVASWPDSVFGAFGTERVEDIGLVAELRRGGGTGAAAQGRFTWPTWEEP